MTSRPAGCRTPCVSCIAHGLCLAPGPLTAATIEGFPMLIDCDQCQLQHTAACEDCVVSYLLDIDDGGPVVVDVDTERALRTMHSAGLTPSTRYTPRGAASG